jgi:hypothetical protein
MLVHNDERELLEQEASTISQSTFNGLEVRQFTFSRL